MITTKLTTITPKLAEEYLKFNTQNRNIRWAHVEFLKNEILAGRWLTTHQGIAFGTDGNLYDGQHRLLAIRAAGRPVQLLITRGIESHVNGDLNLFAMDVIDNGKTRTAADQLGIMHGVANASLTVGAVKVICGACRSGATSKFKLAVGAILPMLAIYGKEIEGLIKQAKNARITRKSGVIGVLAIGAKVDADLAFEFMSQLSSGEEIKRGDPVYALREHIITNGVGARHQEREAFLEIVGNCFYNTIKGTEIRVAKPGRNGIDYLLGKQRANVERIRVALGAGK